MRPPNILLVTIDAYRRDCLQRYAPAYQYTPRTAAATEHFLAFDRCYTSAPWTLPAMTSLLTGVEARRHRRFSHDGVPLTAEPLGTFLSSRYECTAFVNNGNLKPSSSLNTGFSHWRFLRDHGETFTAARAYIDANRDARKPWALFVHSNLPHDFWQARARRYHDQTFPAEEWFCLGMNVLGWKGLDAAQVAAARRAYHACVARLDAELSALLDHVDLNDTVVIVTADHGEGLEPERSRVHHGGRLHDDLLRVPLLIHVPDGVIDRDALARATSTTVGSIDVLPTILAIAGLAIPATLDGAVLGTARAARVLHSDEQRYLYVRGRQRLNVNHRGKNTTRSQRARNWLMRSTVLPWFATRSYIGGNVKLSVTGVLPGERIPVLLAMPVLRMLLGEESVVVRVGRGAAALRLVDLEADPDESVNLIGTPAAEKLLGRLGDVRADCISIGSVAIDVAELAGRASAQRH